MAQKSRIALKIPPITSEMLRSIFSKIRSVKKCWEWSASTRAGYAQFGIGGSTFRAHRLFYEWFIGPIPKGKKIDHTCRNKICMNPWHLEAVTQRVNVLRGISIPSKNAKKRRCKYGHRFTKENTRYFLNESGRPSRKCRTCARNWHRDRRSKMSL